MLLTAVPFFVGATWRLPDTYHSAGFRRGTATLKFYGDRDILGANRRRVSSDTGTGSGPAPGTSASVSTAEFVPAKEGCRFVALIGTGVDENGALTWLRTPFLS